MTKQERKKQQKKQKSLLLHCRHEGCLYHKAFWTMGGITLKKALGKLKNYSRQGGALRQLAPCCKGKKHHWDLVRSH